MVHRAGRIGMRLRRIGPAMAVALVCCTVPAPPKPDDNVFPTKYKELVVTFVTNDFQDPTNIRGAFISEPMLASVGGAQRWTSCVRFDPRTSGRRYSGSEDRLAVFLGGSLNQLVPATPAQCGNASYKPFPELEKICKGERCD